MSSLTVASLCTGYGGLDLAVKAVLGGELAWVADNDPDVARILAHRFPAVKNLGDLTAVDWAAVEPADVLTVGSPCQDISAAGRRAGMLHGNRSGVWHEAVRAITVLRPRLVVIENVLGLLSARGDEPTAEHVKAEAARDATARLRHWVENEQKIAAARGDTRRVKECRARAVRVMGIHKRAVARCRWHEQRLVRAIGTVLGTLASLGLDAEWTVLSAADAGSCHLRKRVFLIAWPAANTGSYKPGGHGAVAVIGQREAGEGPGAGGRGAPEDPDSATGGERRVAAPGQAEGGGPRADARRSGGAPAADPDCERVTRDGLPQRREPALARSGAGTSAPADPGGARLGEHPGEPPAEEARTDAGDEPAGDRGPWPVPDRRPAPDWGPYEPAIRRWEHVTGREAPRPTEPGRTGERLSPRFVEFLMGLPAGWVTDVPGLSRNAQLKALGNGVVPAQAEMALRLLLERAGFYGRERAA